MRAVARSLPTVLEWLPGIGQILRLVHLMHAIRRLEEERNWEENEAPVGFPTGALLSSRLMSPDRRFSEMSRVAC